MDEFFLKSYKEYLIDFYVYGGDINAQKKRKAKIDSIDENYLIKIIEDTKKFILSVLDKMKEENAVFKGNIFTSVDISGKVEFISNGCIGGWPADELYDCEGLTVSRHLLNSFFKDFRIEVSEDEEDEFDVDTQIGGLYYYLKLVISGKVEEFAKLYDNNELKRETEKDLVKVHTMIKAKKANQNEI